MRLSSRVVTHTGTALVLALLGACSEEEAPDARVIPRFPDSPPAVTIDAHPPMPDAPPTFAKSGTVSVQDIQVLVTNGATVVVAPAGHGGNVNISFTPDLSQPGVADALTEEHAGSFGLPPCFAVRYDNQGKAPPANSDQGAVTFTGSTAAIPPCAFASGGYHCVGGAGTGGAIAPTANPAVSTF